MSKGFLATCIALMIAAGFYGATDMVRDLNNGELINYENVRERHAKSLLFIIKTTGLGTHKFRGSESGKERKVKEAKDTRDYKTSKVVEYLEEFSRGDEI